MVLANEAEVCALHSTDDFATALRRTAEMARTIAVTRGARGSVVAQGSASEVVPAAAVPQAVDATGAGDLYAAGFLWGLKHDVPLARCAELGSLAAAEVISHVGARPSTALSEFVAAKGFANR